MNSEKAGQRGPSLTVDAILVIDKKILLVERGRKPFKGMFALPGGFVEYGERVEDAVVREMKEETGLDVRVKCILGVYSEPDRDPRGHTASVVFEVERTGGEIMPGDDASDVKLFPLDSLPQLAFDHRKIIDDYPKGL